MSEGEQQRDQHMHILCWYSVVQTRSLNWINTCNCTYICMRDWKLSLNSVVMLSWVHLDDCIHETTQKETDETKLLILKNWNTLFEFCSVSLVRRLDKQWDIIFWAFLGFLQKAALKAPLKPAAVSRHQGRWSCLADRISKKQIWTFSVGSKKKFKRETEGPQRKTKRETKQQSAFTEEQSQHHQWRERETEEVGERNRQTAHG